jgi:hypothetical protein
MRELRCPTTNASRRHGKPRGSDLSRQRLPKERPIGIPDRHEQTFGLEFVEGSLKLLLDLHPKSYVICLGKSMVVRWNGQCPGNQTEAARKDTGIDRVLARFSCVLAKDAEYRTVIALDRFKGPRCMSFPLATTQDGKGG